MARNNDKNNRVFDLDSHFSIFLLDCLKESLNNTTIFVIGTTIFLSIIFQILRKKILSGYFVLSKLKSVLIHLISPHSVIKFSMLCIRKSTQNKT